MKNIFFLLFAAILTLAPSCKKDNINPEPEHKDVFRCKVNGELWTPAGGDGTWGFDKELLVLYEQEFLNSIYVSAKREIETDSDTISQKILLYPNLNDSIIGRHPLYHENYHFVDRMKNGSYYLDTLYNNYLEINSIDTVEKIITGTFQFKAIEHTIQDTVFVTEGEISAKYGKG